MKLFLETLSAHFSLVLFTSATDEYAQEVRDIIDPQGHLFEAVFCRDHCTRSRRNGLIKDLKIFRLLDPQYTFLVDNSPSAFASNLRNAIPIAPFTGDPSDDELPRLCDYLLQLKDSEFPLTQNHQYFGLERSRLRTAATLQQFLKHLCS